MGQHGVNIMEFCKAFNDKTKEFMGSIVLVIITVYEDRSFTFIVKSSPAARLILKHINLKKGSSEPNKTKVGTITKAQLEEIGETKEADLNGATLEANIRTIEGTARSMGVLTEGRSINMVQAIKKSVEMKVHAIDEALALVKEGAKAKFDESIDMVIQLGVDTVSMLLEALWVLHLAVHGKASISLHLQMMILNGMH